MKSLDIVSITNTNVVEVLRTTKRDVMKYSTKDRNHNLREVVIHNTNIITELSEEQKTLVHHPFVRKFFIFCAFFMATRDIQCALILTILFVLIVSGLFNGDVFFLTKKS